MPTTMISLCGVLKWKPDKPVLHFLVLAFSSPPVFLSSAFPQSSSLTWEQREAFPVQSARSPTITSVKTMVRAVAETTPLLAETSVLVCFSAAVIKHQPEAARGGFPWLTS